jgi:dimethylargininase
VASTRLQAFVREVSPSLSDCALTHLPRNSIDLNKATAQHGAYCELLQELGCEVHRLASHPSLPDSVFIEDTAVVTDELAILTRPGAVSRRPEVDAVAKALKGVRPTETIRVPGTLDGGDVLRIGRRLYVGLGTRTNQDAVDQLTAIGRRFGYEVKAVPLGACLHLKTAVTEVRDGTVLLNPRWVDRRLFSDFEIVEPDPAEPFGANALRLGGSLVYSSAHPRTGKKLDRLGLDLRLVDISELAKAEAGVTCCSLIVKA